IFYWYSCCSPLIISVCIKICYGSFHLFIIYFFIGTDAVAINHFLLYQNLSWLVSSVYYLFFIGTDAVAINHFCVYHNLSWLVSYNPKIAIY
ncbi:MAG: hypothetical protein Q7U21_03845, partial [Lutibacter sp.]|nr:hypothetical protein [Lutibacter sp.]